MGPQKWKCSPSDQPARCVDNARSPTGRKPRCSLVGFHQYVDGLDDLSTGRGPQYCAEYVTCGTSHCADADFPQNRIDISPWNPLLPSATSSTTKESPHFSLPSSSTTMVNHPTTMLLTGLSPPPPCSPSKTAPAGESWVVFTATKVQVIKRSGPYVPFSTPIPPTNFFLRPTFYCIGGKRHYFRCTFSAVHAKMSKRFKNFTALL